MSAADNESRSGMSRRDALRLLAASTTTVAAGSVIVSQPALADSGSTPCRYNFTGTPLVTIKLINISGSSRNRPPDFLSVEVTGVTGDCPCTTPIAPVIEYSYFITIPGIGTGVAEWMSSSSASVVDPPELWPNSGGTATISVGIRVTCPAAVGTAMRCRFGTETFNIAGPNSNTTQTFMLTSDNGDSPPIGIPSCGASSRRSVPPLSSGNSLSVVPGQARPPTIDTLPESPSGRLAPAEPSTTTSTTPSTTTSTTTSPSTTLPPG